MVTYAPPKPVIIEDAQPVDMRVICKQEDLARGLSLVNHATLNESTIPILNNILVATDRGRLRLSATTLELAIQVWIDAEVQVAGTTVLPAALLTKIVPSLPRGKMTLTLPQGSQTLKIAGAGSLTNIRAGGDPKEFPIIPGFAVTSDRSIPMTVIDAGVLKDMIDQVAFSAGKDLSKPIMTGVKTCIEEKKMSIAAADEFRLAERVTPLADISTAPADILIPARNLLEIARILPSRGRVQIMVTPQKNQIIFHIEEGEHIDVVSRLLEGTYPPYKKTIPKAHVTRAIVNTKKFAAAIESAMYFARDDKKSVRITMKGAREGSLTVEADDPDLGNHIQTIEAEVSGPEQELFFHVKYLVEALAHIDAPLVAFEATAKGRPGVLKPTGDIEYTSLVMSMSTNKTTV